MLSRMVSFIVCFAVIEVICNSASYEYLLLILYSLSSLNSFFNVLILFFKSFIIKSMNEWKIFICFLSFIEIRKMTKISCFICNILYSSTGVMRASNPSHSCREEASNTPATSTQEEKHPQSLPRGRKNERLYRMDLPRNWKEVQEPPSSEG